MKFFTEVRGFFILIIKIRNLLRKLKMPKAGWQPETQDFFDEDGHLKIIDRAKDVGTHV